MKDLRRSVWCGWALFAAVFAAAPLAGCKTDEDGLDTEQRQTRDRFTEIMEKSGGDWEKLEAADKDWIVNTLSNGNEQAARTMFQMRASRNPPGSVPGGPPR